MSTVTTIVYEKFKYSCRNYKIFVFLYQEVYFWYLVKYNIDQCRDKVGKTDRK